MKVKLLSFAPILKRTSRIASGQDVNRIQIKVAWFQEKVLRNKDQTFTKSKQRKKRIFLNLKKDSFRLFSMKRGRRRSNSVPNHLIDDPSEQQSNSSRNVSRRISVVPSVPCVSTAARTSGRTFYTNIWYSIE